MRSRANASSGMRFVLGFDWEFANEQKSKYQWGAQPTG